MLNHAFVLVLLAKVTLRLVSLTTLTAAIEKWVRPSTVRDGLSGARLAELVEIAAPLVGHPAGGQYAPLHEIEL